MNLFLTYCTWTTIWFILNKLNIVKISPYPSVLIALIFTTILIWHAYDLPEQTGLFILLWHFALVYFSENKWDQKTVFTNFIIFTSYLIYLDSENESFSSVYKKVHRKLNKKKLTIARYLKIQK